MTKYKEYIKSKGYKLESDLPYMPYDIGGIALINIIPKVDLERKIIILVEEFAVDTVMIYFNKNGEHHIMDECSKMFYGFN